jgi:hypothetical protein
LNLLQRNVQDLLKEKEQGGERLILGRGADVAVDGEVGQELVDLGGPRFKGCLPGLILC